jgi:hypothetical protein
VKSRVARAFGEIAQGDWLRDVLRDVFLHPLHGLDMPLHLSASILARSGNGFLTLLAKSNNKKVGAICDRPHDLRKYPGRTQFAPTALPQ